MFLTWGSFVTLCFSYVIQIIPTQMKRMPEDGSMDDSSLSEEIIIDPVVRGYIRDWDAMEDLLHHVLYSGLGWEMGNEGQILFTDPLSTPKVRNFFLLVSCQTLCCFLIIIFIIHIINSNIIIILVNEIIE